MGRIRLYFTAIVSLITLNVFSANDTTLAIGWQYFAINDYESARNYFDKVIGTGNSSQKAESYLAYSLMSLADRPEGRAFGYFNKFYEITENPSPYLYALWDDDNIFGSDFYFMNKDKVKLLNSIIALPDVNPTVKSEAELYLARHYRSINKFKKAKEYYSKLGSVTIWQAAGRFENISGSGFNKDYGPLHHPEPSASFKGYKGAEVKWFNIDTTLGDWTILENYFYLSRTLSYLQTFCTSDSDKEVVFRMGVQGSLKVWVNDALVFSEPEERLCGFDCYSFPVKLNKGNNRILLQVGNTDQNHVQFILRITDAKGNKTEGLSFTTQYSDYQARNGSQTLEFPVFAEEYFLNLIEKNPDKLLYRLMLAKTYLRNNKSYECHKVLDDILRTNNECSYALKMLGDIYLNENNQIQHKLVCQRLKAVNHPYYLKYHISELIADSSYTDAGKELDIYESLKGRDKFWYIEKMNLLLRTAPFDFMYFSNEAYLAYPYDDDIVTLKFMSDRLNSFLINPSEVLNKYIRNYFSPDVILTLIRFNIKIGKTKKIPELTERVDNYYPGFSYMYSEIADAFYEKEDYREAIKYYNKAIRIKPVSYILYKKVAKSYKKLGDKENAALYFGKAVKFKPDDYYSRRMKREMLNEPDIFSYFTTPDADGIFQNSPGTEEYPDESSIILLNETQTVVYPEGGQEERTYLMVKVFNTLGINIWKERIFKDSDVLAYEIEKAEVLKSNGGRLKAFVSAGHIVFGSLEPGDAIYIVTRSKYHNNSLFINNFGGKFYFNTISPVLFSKYSILVPAGRRFNYDITNATIEPETFHKENFDIYTWTAKDRPSIKIESLMPAFDDVGEVLSVSDYESWEDISGKYYDIYRNNTQPDYDLKKLVSTLFKGNRNLTEFEKAQIIYNYTLKSITYSAIPLDSNKYLSNKAAIILSKKSGGNKDITNLFVAMCRAAGLNANAVLVATREIGMGNLSVPVMNFNFIIAKVTCDNKDYYAEFDFDKLSFPSLRFQIRNGVALETGENGKPHKPFVLNPPTREKDISKRKGTVRFEDRNMIIEKNNIKTGMAAAMFRFVYHNTPKNDIKNKMEDAISMIYPKVKLTSLKFNNELMSLSDSVQYYFSYTVSNAFSNYGDIYFIDLPLERPQKKIMDLDIDNRKYPIQIDLYFRIDEIIEDIDIILPAGMKLAEMPENVILTCKYADYKKEFVLKGDTLQLKYKLLIKKSIVDTEGLQEFKNFMENVLDSDSQKIAFRKI